MEKVKPTWNSGFWPRKLRPVLQYAQTIHTATAYSTSSCFTIVCLILDGIVEKLGPLFNSHQIGFMFNHAIRVESLPNHIINLQICSDSSTVSLEDHLSYHLFPFTSIYHDVEVSSNRATPSHPCSIGIFHTINHPAIKGVSPFWWKPKTPLN